MALVPIFHGAVSADGRRLDLDVCEQARRRLHLATLAGERVDVVIRRQRKQRTSKQNAYLHAIVFPILAEFFGCDIAEVKRDLMGECWGWRVDERLRREVPVRPHTAGMSVEEATYFIEWVIPWALTTWNVSIPLPNEAEAA